MSHRDTVAALIFLGGGFHFKAIEGAALRADSNLDKVRPEVAIEAVLIHAEELRRVAQPNESRLDCCRGGQRECVRVHRRPVRQLRFRPFRDELSLRTNHLRFAQESLLKFRGKTGQNLARKLPEWPLILTLIMNVIGTE